MESPVPDKRVSLVFSPSALTALYQGLTAKTRAPGQQGADRRPQGQRRRWRVRRGALRHRRQWGTEPAGGEAVKATRLLHARGQSLCSDNIPRDLLDSGTLKRYIDLLSVTGLPSTPTIFDHAIKNSTAY